MTAADPDALVGSWLTLAEAAQACGTPESRLRQLAREGRLLTVRRGSPPQLCLPAVFVHEGGLLRGITGLLTVLHDAGFTDIEALRWLFTADDSLPGRPVDALAANRGAEVKRRAQALAL